MAATNIQVLNTGDKVKSHADVIGQGVPANGDLLCTNLNAYPIGSTYLNTTGATTTTKFFIRFAANGVAADWIAVTTS